VQLNPSDMRLGYLEQRQRYAERDTLADFLQVGEAVLQAAARMAQFATALATADDVEQAPLMKAYGEAKHPVPVS